MKCARWTYNLEFKAFDFLNFFFFIFKYDSAETPWLWIFNKFSSQNKATKILTLKFFEICHAKSQYLIVYLYMSVLEWPFLYIDVKVGIQHIKFYDRHHQFTFIEASKNLRWSKNKNLSRVYSQYCLIFYAREINSQKQL